MFSVGDVKREKSASHGVLRRLNNLAVLRSSDSSGLSGSSQPLAVTRVQDDHSEICVNTHSTSKVVRRDVDRGEWQVFVTRPVCRRGAGADWCVSEATAVTRQTWERLMGKLAFTGQIV